MKASLLLPSLFLLLVPAAAMASDSDPTPGTPGVWRPKVVESRFHTAYIPDGFDSNDQSQIVVEGIFPNTCYRHKGATVTVDKDAKVIKVQGQAYYYEGVCLQVLVPYHQVVDLGILDVGTYRVVQSRSEEPLGDMYIRQATKSNPDDYLYAPISQAFYKNEGGVNKVVLTGEFTTSCMKLADVLTQVQPRVITVQPIAELEDRNDCAKGKFPFEKTIELPSMESGRYLLHVRSINAKALNSLVDIP